MGVKVLAIEDDEVDRMSMKRNLEKASFEVLEAENGEEGIKIAEDEKPDIVITDTNLGSGIDGFETCRRIKEIESLDTKVIICTGAIDAFDAGKAREMGADEYCVKTNDNEVLVKAVQQLSKSK